MSNEYVKAAEKLSDIADEVSNDYDLANLLRASSSKIMQLAQRNNAFIKNATSQSGEYMEISYE